MTTPADDPTPLWRVTHTPAPVARLGFVAATLAAFGFGAASFVRPEAGWGAGVAVAAMVVLAVRMLIERPFPKAFLEVHDEGVLVYPPDDSPPRLVRWAVIHDIHGSDTDGRGDDQTPYLTFELAGTRWKLACPGGVGNPARLAVRLAELRPAHRPPASRDDVLHRLESAFGFRLPPDSRLVDAEMFSDATGRWDLDMPEETFRELRSTTLRCSPWFPLPPDMHFTIGGARTRAGVPADALYAIGTDDALATAVLIRERHGPRLVCLRVAAMD